MLGWILMIDNVIPGYPIFQSNPSNHYCLRFVHLESQWPQADADCNWSCYPAGYTNHCSWIIGEVPYSDDSTLDWCFKIKHEHIIPVSISLKPKTHLQTLQRWKWPLISLTSFIQKCSTGCGVQLAMPPNARVLQSILPPRAWLVTRRPWCSCSFGQKSCLESGRSS